MSKKQINREKLRRQLEGISTFGLLIIAVAMVGPFASGMDNMAALSVYKWIYAAGALIFLLARLVGSTDRGESLRLRRLRRLEFWAGMAFAVGAFFWFYNESRFAHVWSAGPLAILQNTILFTLAGAMIQVIASWMITSRMRKEQSGSETDTSVKGSKKNKS
ncbi:MAG: hypothetical protein K2H86_08105 [Muribaculaceae bacterium]|nr:hypothetical protein [Muribaculaceae bacterium]